jgi:hypothetical protein
MKQAGRHGRHAARTWSIILATTALAAPEAARENGTLESLLIPSLKSTLIPTLHILSIAPRDRGS